MSRTAWLAMAASALLAACASPPVNFYTLLAPGAGHAAQPAPAPAGVSAVQVLPVSIPAELDLPQIVVRSGQGEVVPLNGERWAGPLADQIRASLAAGLAARLPVPVVQSAMPAGDPQGLWRVQVEVQRFESTPNEAAALEAVWWAAPARSPGQPPLCRAYFRSPVQAGMPALVAGHQRNLSQLSDAIAAAIERAGKTGLRCP